MEIRLAGITSESVVDGPGFRLVIFAQGCPHLCEGCHNPSTHDSNAGKAIQVEDVYTLIENSRHISGITFSGGEPFMQPEAFWKIGLFAKKNGKDIWAYTGYTFEELLGKAKSQPIVGKLLEIIDVLVDGPFVLPLRSLNTPFRGSSNQRVISVKHSIQTGQIILWQEKQRYLA